MKKWLGMGLIFVSLAVLDSFSKGDDRDSLKQVVENFCKFETAGGRLSGEGWRKGSVFFVHPTRRSTTPTIFVTDNEYSVWDPVMKGPNSALVIVGVTGDVWQIDPSMQIKRRSSAASPKTGIAYKLVRTEKHWVLGADGQLKEVSGDAEWRIEGDDNTIWLTKDRAIQYLMEAQNKSPDAGVKQNANRTIAFLRKHLR